MDLKQKYSALIQYAQTSGVQSLNVNENNGVLYVSGSASPSVKDKLWSIYKQVDPDMRAGDLVLDITLKPGSDEIYEVKSGDNLSKIANQYRGLTWKQIYEANKETLKDPDKIYPGQKLRIPVNEI